MPKTGKQMNHSLVDTGEYWKHEMLCFQMPSSIIKIKFPNLFLFPLKILNFMLFECRIVCVTKNLEAQFNHFQRKPINMKSSPTAVSSPNTFNFFFFLIYMILIGADTSSISQVFAFLLSVLSIVKSC